MSTPTPSEQFSSALDAMLAGRLEDVHVSMPGRIDAYDRDRQKATVQPMVQRVYRDAHGDLKEKPYPACTDVPVEFFGGGDYALTFPIVKGMTCRLVFCSAAIDRFLALGGEQAPGDARRFSLTDAICVVGLRDFPHAIKGLPSDAWVMAAPTGARILLGSSTATQKAILGDTFRSKLDALLIALDTFANANIGGPAMTTAINAFKAQWTAMLAAKVRIE